MDHAGRPDVQAPAGVIPPSERVVFEGETVTIGAVRCAPGDRHFRNCGRARVFSFVFPRAAVTIRRPGESAFLEDPTRISFYNRGQEYERFEVSPDGDCCDWFGVSPEVLRDAVRGFDPAAADDPVRLLRPAHVSSPPDVFVRQRLLFEKVRRREAVDPVCVEETVIGLLHDVLAHAYGAGSTVHEAPRRARDIADAARHVVARRYAEPLTLSLIARQLDVSIFQLCHAFRTAGGTTIHRYITELRLRRALERMLDGSVDLGQLAIESGYETHSHFSAVFRRHFGRPPSRLRLAVRDDGPRADPAHE